MNALLDLTSNPVELLHAKVLPDGVVTFGESLSILVVLREGAGLLEDIILGLLLNLGKLVHVFAASMVLLRLRVADGLVKTLAESLVIRALLAEPLVVALEAFDALNRLELCLKVVLDVLRQTTEVIVNLTLEAL